MAIARVWLVAFAGQRATPLPWHDRVRTLPGPHRSDPGFTLRTYTHLMPSSEERTRRAIDELFGGEEEA